MFQEKHQISYSFKPGKTFGRKLPEKKKKKQQQQPKKKKKTLNMLTIRVDCERINGRYTNAEYRGKMTRCDLTLNIGPYAECVCVCVGRRGGGGGEGVHSHPPSWTNYFKIMQIFTRN